MKNFILFYHIKVEYRQQSYIYKRTAFKTQNRAGYMTDWLLVNGILMWFFSRTQARVVDPSDHVLAEILGRLFCLGYSHHSLDLIICPFLGASEPLNIYINRSSICGLCEWCCTIPKLYVKPCSKGMEEFIMLQLFMFYTR